MKLHDTIKIESTKLAARKTYCVVKKDFKVLDLENYLQEKKYPILKESINSDYILIILSSENERYKKHREVLEYKASFLETIRKLKTFVFHQNEKASHLEYYVVIEKEHFINNESLFYELLILFNFTLIIGLKEKLNKEDLLKKLNRFSFYDVFNFKRWSDISNWQLFFDADHLSGIIKYENPEN